MPQKFEKQFVERFIFSDAERVTVYKVTSLTTQEIFAEVLNTFNRNSTQDILVLIVHVDNVPLMAINHMRVLIEEEEALSSADKHNNVKLYVVLVHFSPQHFFNHCYPSYFLNGWDHYYLDTFGLGYASVNIHKWFSESYIHYDDKSPTSFMDPKFLHGLLEEAIPVVAPRIDLQDIKGHELPSSEKNSLLRKFLSVSEVGQLIGELFHRYWEPSVMTDISDKVSKLGQCEFSFSITDSVNTIIRSSAWDFLLYIFSLMNEYQVVNIVVSSGEKSAIKNLALNILSMYPIPKDLSELKIQSIRFDQINSRTHRSTISFSFPFFLFVYDIVEEMLSRCWQDTNSLVEAVVRKKTRTQSAPNLKQIQAEFVDNLENLLHNKPVSFAIHVTA